MIEILEPKRLFAFALYEGYPGYFELEGDGTDIAAVIEQPNNFDDHGTAVITNEGVVTTIPGVDYLVINGTAGPDVVDVTENGFGPVGVFVSGFAGADTLSLNANTNGGALDGGSGNDILRFFNVSQGEIFGGPGGDTLIIGGSCWSTITIRGGGGWTEGTDGGDTFRCQGNANGLHIQVDAGPNTVYGTEYADVVFCEYGIRNRIYGYGGDDLVYSNNGSIDIIDLGVGQADTVFSNEPELLYNVEYRYQ